MSSDSKLFNYAIQLAQQAVALDRAGKKGEAIQKYTRAAEILLEFMKYTKNEKLRNLCEGKVSEYINRAKFLKTGKISTRRPRGAGKLAGKVDGQTTGGDHGASGEEPEAEELTEEEEKIREAISDTVMAEVPDVTWDDIAGLGAAKQALREAIVLPILQPKIFSGARKPWSGILLFGPPGTGKTLLAKAAANECNSTFFVADSASLTSKWLGESEKLIRELFNFARKKSPSIVFFDEIDSLASARSDRGEGGGERRIKTQLLSEIQGVRGKGDKIVLILGATNRPWDIDSAILRRFEKRIYVDLPDDEARAGIFRIHTVGVDLDPDVEFHVLAGLSAGYSGSDIATVCREALMMPVRELDLTGGFSADSEIEVRPVNLEDFKAALSRVKPVVGKDELERFASWRREFGG
ncbi:MAG: AAA family ATPase [Promethearchaeota archaeon]